MEETVELDLEPAPESTPSEAAQAESIAQNSSQIPVPMPDSTPSIDSTQKLMRKKKPDA
jgi:hypothetical protein